MTQGYQAGGLAAAVGPPEEDEFAPTVDSLIPDPAPDLHKIARMNRETALERLRAGREQLATRRAQMQQAGERDKWLALAQGMLAPTRTGGFGEALGTTAGLLRQEAQMRREADAAAMEEERKLLEAETGIESDYLSALTKIESGASAARPRVAGSEKVYHPDDTAAVRRGEMAPEDRRIVYMTTLSHPDGSVEAVFSETEEGEPIEVVSRLDPGLVASLQQAKDVAGSDVELLTADAQAGLAAMRTLPKITRAREILNGLERGTSGLQETVRSLTNYLGISADTIPDNVDLAELQNIFGQTILSELQKLTGPKSDFEYGQVRDMNAALSNDIEGNKRILDNMVAAYNRVIDDGELAAGELSTMPGQTGYLSGRYRRFRDTQRPKEEAAAPAREPIEGALQRLQERIEALGPEATKEEHDRELDLFRKHWDIPDDFKVTLRKMGVAI